MMKRQFLIIVTALLGGLAVFAEQILVPDIVLVSGNSATVEIELSNECLNLVAFQLDLTLPEGVSIDKAGCALSSRVTDEEQELFIGRLESGVYRLTSTSLSLTPINDTDGTLLTLRLTTANTFVSGQVMMSNIRFSTSGSERIVMNDVSFVVNTIYNVTFMYGDQVFQTIEVPYGAEIPLPESLDSERYTLLEWLEVPATMPAHDITIYASFTDGVKMIRSNTQDAEYYQLNGVKFNILQHGVNILRMSDGTTKKVLVK